MAKAVGIQFPNNTKVYFFDPGDLALAAGETVVVESELGVSVGRVVRGTFDPGEDHGALKPVLRRITSEDEARIQDNEALLREARGFFNERIMARGLPMKLLGTEVTLDRKRLLFYFVAENRIDFRELVKDLASRFRTRIELRQIGVRDAARMVGGLGVCGREFCCSTFLVNFAPTSIKMAKQQGLVLNTAKLSGQCGRLMCCLHYEYDENAPRVKPEPRARAAAPPAPPEPPLEEPVVAAVGEADVRQPAGDRPREQGRRRSRGRRRPDRPKAEPVQAAPESRTPGTVSDARPEAPRPEGEQRKRRPRRGRRRGPGGGGEKPGETPG